MSYGFDLSALTVYTQENTDLIAGTILSTDALSNISVRTGVSAGTTTLNVFSANFADSSRSCGWADDAATIEAANSMVFGQVPVTVSDRQIKALACVPELREYWLSERMQPGEAGNEELPFAELISSYYLVGIKKNVEDFVGTQIAAEVLAGANVYPGAAALTVSNALEQLNGIYDTMSEAAREQGDVILMMSPANYRTAIRAIVAAGDTGFFHYTAGDGTGAQYLPGTDAKLVKNSGLSGTDTIVALPGSWAVFCTGLMDDMDKFNMFYDQSADVVKVSAFYRRGLGVYQADQCATNGL